jgi:hypothetical protein
MLYVNVRITNPKWRYTMSSTKLTETRERDNFWKLNDASLNKVNRLEKLIASGFTATGRDMSYGKGASMKRVYEDLIRRLQRKRLVL